MERTDYEEQAEEFLHRFGMEIRSAFKGDRCPPWQDGACVHGDRYRVTIKRVASCYQNWPEAKSLSFDFWNSYSDMLANKASVSAYDVLSSISSDAFSPTDPDEVAEEYGDMKPSQAIAIAKFAKRLQEFFTEGELEALAEIN